jgi:hypothetical protein
MKTIEDIENYLRSQKVSGVCAVRIRNLANAFATVDAFFTAKKVDIERMYQRTAPGNKHGIGKKFWDVFDMALAYYKGLEDKNDEPVHKEVHEEHEPAVDVRLMKMHSYEELKAIVDMMEFCGIASINFLEIAGFLENVKFRQKSTSVAPPFLPDPNGFLNADKQQ